MKKIMLLGTAGVLALGAAITLIDGSIEKESAKESTRHDRNDAVSIAVQTSIPPLAPTPEQHRDNAMLASEITAFEARRDFLDALQSFLEAPETVAEAQRADTAEDYRERVREHAERGEFSAAETLMLELALLRHQVPDDVYEAHAQALIAHYADDSAAREAAWRAQATQTHAAYKERERAVVEEVRAMEHFPDGMTRGQYLRERLQAERERLADD
ncbi:hypothetical protein K8B33_01155 [Alcanivorax sp. JB21]|uniref:hypothetical protein n=1 Tax=Alcanivorax limicola TaxID=2874102 RepID=UPI001CBE981D|nr:hypothetical protein [Alcanivorax limicola]MBZ2187692.1 hypothetical protein [Alcanivorax limicola]